MTLPLAEVVVFPENLAMIRHVIDQWCALQGESNRLIRPEPPKDPVE